MATVSSQSSSNNQAATQRLVMRRPDDAHLHLRDGEALQFVLAATVRQFARAIVMPNLKPAVVDVAQAKAYQSRIISTLKHLAEQDSSLRGLSFTPLMTLYLTEETSASTIQEAAATDAVLAAKLYPAGATTNSQAGVKDLLKFEKTLEVMEKAGLPLLIHGELADPAVDVFDKEKVFIEKHLQGWRRKFPALKIVLEHITTGEAVDFLLDCDRQTTAATITAHHLLLNRNHMFEGGIRPHHYCLPILKRESHRLKLRAAVASRDTRFFLGTDSAPHALATKETSCGCAGIYSAPVALEVYAQVFEELNCLDYLETFASESAARFYELPLNEGTITLSKQEWQVEDHLPFINGTTIVPFRSGLKLPWKILA